jgi:hypothetical protein
MDEEQLRAATVGEMPTTYEDIVLAEYDPRCPAFLDGDASGAEFRQCGVGFLQAVEAHRA